MANRENAQGVTWHALSELAVAWVETEGLEILNEIVSSISHADEYEFCSHTNI